MVQQMMPMDIQGTRENVAANRRQFKHIGKSNLIFMVSRPEFIWGQDFKTQFRLLN